MVDFLLFLGKMVIVVGAGTMSYFVFYGYFPEILGDDDAWKIPHLNYSFTPIICIVIGTYFITTSFFNVYSMAVDTLFLCFLQDLKQNDGTPQRPYFMSKGLQNAVGAMQRFREKNVNQRLKYLKEEKERLDNFELQPMLNE
jgi:choline transporter-like protein 2/4/5